MSKTWIKCSLSVPRRRISSEEARRRKDPKMPAHYAKAKLAEQGAVFLWEVKKQEISLEVTDWFNIKKRRR